MNYKTLIFSVYSWINRFIFISILFIYIILFYSIPRCTEDYINPNGNIEKIPIRLDYFTVNSLLLFIPILPLFLFAFLELKNKKTRYIFLFISTLSFLVFLLFRILLECPEI